MRFRLILLIGISVLIGAAQPVFSFTEPISDAGDAFQTAPFDPIAFEHRMQDAIEISGIDGLVILLVAGDDVVFLSALGQDANGEPMNPVSAFDIGRLSDSFLATLVIAESERGLIEPRDAVDILIDDFTLPGRQSTANITVSRLLNHTAGLGGTALAPLESLPMESLQDLILLHYPGARFSYCTRCYGMLVTLLERLSGKSLSDLMHDIIFYPLQMDSTRIEDHRILTTALDMAKFISMQAQAGRWQQVQMLKPENLLMMQTRIVDTERSLDEEYGYGWFVDSDAGLETITRADDRLITAYDFENYSAQMTIAPAYRRGILLLTDQPTDGLDSLMNIALEAFMGWTPPPFDVPADLRIIAGNFSSTDPILGGDIVLEVIPPDENNSAQSDSSPNP
ncbi:MAG TPA: serine hydrolase domain-containing protein, partial [Aggregatilineales bacterium]|nr:serine hydrolase domain-containing protein [Aggregatilineales bacterium]